MAAALYMKMKKLWLSPHLKSPSPHVANGDKVGQRCPRHSLWLRTYVLDDYLDVNRSLPESPVLLLECFDPQFVGLQFNFENSVLLLQGIDPFVKLVA